MIRLLGILTLLFAFTQPATAQFADEADFNKAQAEKLDDYAKKAFKRGFPRQAKHVWLMVLSLYDPDHESANESLGNARVGNSWGPRSDFRYPTEDNPDAGAAKALRSEWESLSKQVGNAHRALAQKYQKAGRDDRARYHFEKVVRYIANDRAAAEALNHEPVEGVSGTALEATLFERSKKIEKAVEEQFKVEYPVEVLPESETSALLDRAQVPHRSVKSEHFVIRGDFDVELLTQTAVHAERAIRVVSAAFEGSPGYMTDVAKWPMSELLFVTEKEALHQIMDANADKFVGDKDDFAFTRKESSSAAFRDEKGGVSVSAVNIETVMFDSAVRRVAQMAAGFQSAALNEGIGHTIVGMFFNSNRLFSIDRKRQIGTSSEEEIEYNSPNFDEWKDLALEGAWKRTGTSAAELPLFTAAEFPNEARIKAWSFCDYVVRRDPALLRDLDRLNPNAGLRNPIAIEEKFTADHDGLTIAQLEKEWRDFWTEASPVLKAIRNNTPPLDAVSKDVEEWLTAFNEARKALQVSTVNWSAAYSSRCAEHAAYLKANKKERGPAREQMQDTDLELASHLGNMFAQMALIETKSKKPKDVMSEWMAYPGYRDALLNSFLWTVGMYAERGILVMDVIRGVRNTSKQEGGGFTFYPRGQRDVPHEIAVADLGPELAQLLAEHGHGDKKIIGYPISFHSFLSLPGQRNTFRCQLLDQNQPVEGILHIGAAGGSNRRTSAPGMVVFYPLEPLARGRSYTVSWSFTKTGGEIERVSGEFVTK